MALQLGSDPDGCQNPSGQGSDRGAQNFQVKNVDQNCVADDVDYIHDQAGFHADLTVSLSAEKCGTGIIKTDKGIRNGADVKINLRIVSVRSGGIREYRAVRRKPSA